MPSMARRASLEGLFEAMAGEPIERIAWAAFPFFRIMVGLVLTIPIFLEIVLYRLNTAEFRGQGEL